MEETIKILEELTVDLKKEEKLIGYDAEVEIKAIESLIDEYRKKQEIILEAKKYIQHLQKYVEYEKKYSKLGRRINLMKEGLTMNCKISRIANNILSILEGTKWKN